MRHKIWGVPREFLKSHKNLRERQKFAPLTFWCCDSALRYGKKINRRLSERRQPDRSALKLGPISKAIFDGGAMQEINNPDSTVECAMIVAPVPTTQHPIQLILEQVGLGVEVCHSHDMLGSMKDKSFRLIIVVVQEADSVSLTDTLQNLRPFTANERSFLYDCFASAFIACLSLRAPISARAQASPCRPSLLIQIHKRFPVRQGCFGRARGSSST
jgi:hypothetical protein